MKKDRPKLSLAGTITCRTPALSISAEFPQSRAALLELIRESSRGFFELIKGKAWNHLSLLNEDKIGYSLWKYFNRARFRATPFGSFGAVCCIPTGNEGPPVLEQALQKHKFIGWPEKDMVRATCRPSVFISNSSWYQTGDSIRYLRYTGGTFELASVKCFPELLALLNACTHPLQEESIYTLMAQQFRLGRRSASELLMQLTAGQLLLDDCLPNITGPDYFKRMGAGSKKGQPVYVIAQRKLRSGAFNAAKLRHVADYLWFMNDFLPPPPENNLDSFRKAFTRKFDRKVVPLAVALDPELGVGYGHLDSPAQQGEAAGLLEKLRKTPVQEAVYNQAARYRFLLNGLMRGGTIHLEDYAATMAEPTLPLPNTFSVLFHFSQGQAVIEQAGGCTANALLGRFTLALPAAETAGKQAAGIEEQANPGILFFDVAYQAEKDIDNINRRAAIYPAELPILTWSCSREPLSLAHIVVAVRDGQVILWSAQRRQRIIPRIASAYNYTRSDLALYRFLCDLQHQGIRSDLSFRWSDLFPGLDRYPRVIFRDLTVAPASWKVPAGGPQDLQAWLEGQGITSPFNCGAGDQLLYFDPTLATDRAAFSRYCAQNKGTELYITESLRVPEDGVYDQHGNSYAAEYIAGYSHHATLYQPYEMPAETSPTENRCFPGGEWLYFELYCHPSRSNELLTGFIAPFLAARRTALKKWFFIRYNDPAPHIRLRLQLKKAADCGQLIHDFDKRLNPLLAAGFVSDIQVKTYFRETERYGPEQIELVEDLFYKDSRLVLKKLSAKTSLYRPTLNLVELLCKEVLPARQEQLDFVRRVADAFSLEFGFSHDDYKKINSSFDMLPEANRVLMPGKTYLATFRKVLMGRHGAEKEQLLADLLHMHINRVFEQEQRLQEAILYQYLLKQLKAQRAVPQ